MLTLFAVPKPFRGHIGLIQTNALRAWRELGADCEIILFGDDEGVAEAATEYGVEHVPAVARNEYGTPLLDDVFGQAQTRARNETLCYVNADIILLSDLLVALAAVRRKKERFLMVGSRWDLDFAARLDTKQPDWSAHLRERVASTGTPAPPDWIDYFAFPAGLFGRLLPFALGRAAFDNWLLWKAYEAGAALVDASHDVLAIHQNHDYSHHPQGKQGVWEGPEAQQNRKLMQTWDRCFFVTDATHRLTDGRLRPNLDPKRFRRRWERTHLPERMRARRRALVVRSYPLRRRLGLRRSTLQRLARLRGELLRRRA